jgi:hypothetical protein
MKCVNRKTYSKMVDFPCVDLYVSMSICLLIGLPSTIVYKMSMGVYAQTPEKMECTKKQTLEHEIRPNQALFVFLPLTLVNQVTK